MRPVGDSRMKTVEGIVEIGGGGERRLQHRRGNLCGLVVRVSQEGGVITGDPDVGTAVKKVFAQRSRARARDHLISREVAETGLLRSILMTPLIGGEQPGAVLLERATQRPSKLILLVGRFRLCTRGPGSECDDPTV